MDMSTLLRRFVREALLREAEGGFKYNVGKVPVEQARQYAEQVLQKAGKDLDQEVPKFNENYQLIQSKVQKALDVPRDQMPVIEPEDLDDFEKRLETGHIDIFKPWVTGKLLMPMDMSREQGKKWLTLGVLDGNETDDIIQADVTDIPAGKLLPTQSQIWLEKLVSMIAQHGPGATQLMDKTIIVSKEGYILDGHHRFGYAVLANPQMTMKALRVPMNIKALLQMGNAYSAAIGRQRKG